MSESLLAGGIFLLTYVLIITERIDRTIAAMLGGLAMIVLRVIHQEDAFGHVDWNVIFLLAGMMMIAHVLSETGAFQWLAVKAVQLGNRNPYRIMILLSLVTAVASAALDNVTVVVLIAPVSLLVATNLGLSPIPFLVAEVLASNIGGAATLIGDPPNILIASAAGIDFVTFAANMTPPVLLSLLVSIPLSYFVFRKELVAEPGHRPRVSSLENLITDPVLLRKSLIVIGGVLVAFTFHGTLHLQPATIALLGGMILMLWSGKEPHHVLQHVEWNTLFFFIGLFITVESIVEVGIVKAAADQALRLTGGSVPLTSILLLWLSALASGVVDNIPYTATMIPLIQSLGADGMPVDTLWWALALGADFGGNLTLVGASANVVVASLAGRSGYDISFGRFFRYSISFTLASMLIATLYVWLRYL